MSFHIFGPVRVSVTGETQIWKPREKFQAPTFTLITHLKMMKHQITFILYIQVIPGNIYSLQGSEYIWIDDIIYPTVKISFPFVGLGIIFLSWKSQLYNKSIK